METSCVVSWPRRWPNSWLLLLNGQFLYFSAPSQLGLEESASPTHSNRSLTLTTAPPSCQSTGSVLSTSYPEMQFMGTQHRICGITMMAPHMKLKRRGRAGRFFDAHDPFFGTTPCLVRCSRNFGLKSVFFVFLDVRCLQP